MGHHIVASWVILVLTTMAYICYSAFSLVPAFSYKQYYIFKFHVGPVCDFVLLSLTCEFLVQNLVQVT